MPRVPVAGQAMDRGAVRLREPESSLVSLFAVRLTPSIEILVWLVRVSGTCQGG
jgi:hypothetical protein